MRELADSAYFLLCMGAGRLLRSARYAETWIVRHNGEPQVHKRRRFYATLLIRLSGPLVRILDTGIRVLPQRDWEKRERQIYQTLRNVSIQVEGDGTLVLPHLAGETLATLLDNPTLTEPLRDRSIALAVAALAALHARGFTHGDAMAENVMVDLAAGVAHWFDFENAHDSARSMAWRRADDLRALLATCLLRTPSERFAERLRLILDAYADEDILRELAPAFTSVWRRALTFHLGQAGLSLPCFRRIGEMLDNPLSSAIP